MDDTQERWKRRVWVCVRLKEWEAVLEAYYNGKRQWPSEANTIAFQQQWFDGQEYRDWWDAGGREKRAQILREYQQRT